MPCFDCSPPVLVFWLWPWPKPGLIRSVIAAARGPLAELLDHVGRAAVDVHAQLDDQIERLAIENIGRIDDRRRIAVSRRISGGQRPADFAVADRIDQHALPAHEIENRQVRAGLLGVADHVERPQVVDALGDFRGIVDVGRRAELLGQFRNGHAGDLRAEQRKFWSRGHACWACEWR